MKHTIILICLFCCSEIFGQQIFYAPNERNTTQNFSFEIIGKYKQNYLIYKNTRNTHRITFYTPEMEIKEDLDLNFLPERYIDLTCYPVSDGAIFIYQFQKKNIIYCMGAKVDTEARLKGDPVQIDTAEVGLVNNERKIFSSLISDDKKSLMILKIQNLYQDEYHFSARLLNSSLSVIRSANFVYSVESSKESVGDFSLDNEGNLLFTHIPKALQKEVGTYVNLCIFSTHSDSLQVNAISLGKVYPDELRIKMDNTNRRYVLTSFYSNSRRGNIDGLIFLSFSKDSSRVLQKRLFEFTDELKNIARGDNAQSAAFNDYYLKQFIIRKDGGMIIAAESNYTNNRGSGINRWDYPNNWGWGGMGMGMGMGFGGFGWGTPLNTWGFGMPGSWNGFGTPSVRYFSDNIVIFSFNKEAEMEWNRVLAKSQFDDNSDALLSYHSMNTGKEIVFMYNTWSKRNPMLASQILTVDGQLNRQQLLRSQDKGYEFLIRKAKQVGVRELIVPVYYRNSTSFARVQF